MRKIFYTIALATILSQLPLFPYTILQGIKNHMRLGYGNCNIQTNGELLTIKQFIKPQSLVFDVGANIGDWSNHVLTHEASSNLYIFEPIPAIFDQLMHNLKQYDNLHFFNLALSNNIDTKPFVYYHKQHRINIHELSGFFQRPSVESQLHAIPTIITVSTDTLDSICNKEEISRIHFLKIDTEGAELNILQGAHQMLTNQSIDVIQFEYGPTYKDAKITLKQVFTLLHEYDYEIFRIYNKGLIYLPQWHPLIENYKYSNHLALPKKDAQKIIRGTP